MIAPLGLSLNLICDKLLTASLRYPKQMIANKFSSRGLSQMKKNYRVWLVVVVCGIALLTVAVRPYVLSLAKGARVEANGTAADDLYAGLRWRNTPITRSG